MTMFDVLAREIATSEHVSLRTAYRMAATEWLTIIWAMYCPIFCSIMLTACAVLLWLIMQ